jgi:hypothetical protein
MDNICQIIIDRRCKVAKIVFVLCALDNEHRTKVRKLKKILQIRQARYLADSNPS